MIEDKVSERLMSLSLEQLEAVEKQLTKLASEKKAAKTRTSRLPPVPSNDLDALAAMQGFDLRGLMREISRR